MPMKASITITPTTPIKNSPKESTCGYGIARSCAGLRCITFNTRPFRNDGSTIAEWDRTAGHSGMVGAK